MTADTNIFRAAAVVCLGLLAGQAAAESRAVVITNADYATLPAVQAAPDAPVIAGFKAAGFRVVEGRDLTLPDMRRALSDLLREDDAAGPRVVVLTGHFVHSRSDVWLLDRTAGKDDLMTVDGAGLPLTRVTEAMAGGRPGSVLLLATDGPTVPTGGGLAAGLPKRIARAEGVTVIAGPSDALMRAAAALAREGATAPQALTEILSAEPTLRLKRAPAAKPEGTPVVVTPSPQQPVVVPSQPTRLDDVAQPAADEMAAWTNAKRANSAKAYREFLGKYPNSIFAGAARGRVAEIEAAAAPQADPAAAAELALKLSRAERAQIQRQLTLLGHDTKGIDGAFGTATRAAITRFQRASGLPATGFLTRAQVTRLATEARAREQALEREAAERQAKTDAADAKLWAEQRGQGAAGARRYLDRYPDGLNAKAARRILADAAAAPSPAEAAAAEAARGGTPAKTNRAADDAAWERAKADGGATAFRAYLDRFPKGRHAAEAQRALEALKSRAAADARTEAALDLSPAVRMVVQSRLNAMGLNAGTPNGTFGPDTRAALRRYQAARNLRASGYLDQGTMVRLMSDMLLGQD